MPRSRHDEAVSATADDVVAQLASIRPLPLERQAGMVVVEEDRKRRVRKGGGQMTPSGLGFEAYLSFWGPTPRGIYRIPVPNQAN